MGISRFLGETVYQTYAHYFGLIFLFMSNIKEIICLYVQLMSVITRRLLFKCV